MMRVVVLWSIFVMQGVFGQTYRATIDIAGYKGAVNFEPNGNNMMVTVSIEGANLTEFTNFSITTLPAIFGQLNNAADVCANLGSTRRPLTNLSITNPNPVEVTDLSANEIFNRGLLITSESSDTRLCATVLPVDTDVVSQKATFIGPIVGEVWIRGITNSPGFLILSNLAYSTPVGNETETTRVTFYSYQSGDINDNDFSSRCLGLSGRQSVASLPVGNSATATGKQSAMFVSNFSVPNLGSTVGVIDRANDMHACAYLDQVESKTVTAEVAWENVRGYFTMSQSSPFDSTWTNFSVSGLGSNVPAGYHVHKFPVPQRLDASEQRCSGPNVGGHFNPYGVNIDNSPAAGTGTGDQYEIGDLSGKYGPLSNDSVQGSFVDWNLPLFGVQSVVGRSIVIHYPNSDRWVCASIDYPSTVTTAIVRFTHPAYGFMLFRQESGKPRTDTTVFGELANLSGEETMNHNFHVHEYPVNQDCASAGPHYDPASLADSPVYSTACSPSNPFQCEIGDLSLRHEGLDLGTQLRQSNKFFFTDSFLPLSGSLTIVGRSIVVHNPMAAAPRYACNNITMVHSTVVTNTDNNWKGDDSDGTVSGYISFRQDTQYDRAVVTSDVTGLNNVARTYHIHVLPIDTQALGIAQCGSTSVEGHFDPFGVRETPPPETLTFDQYEVGDLSGKYGTVEGSNQISLSNVRDNNLPFTTGLVSCAGRSIVIHRDDDEGTRWKCNTIDLEPADNTGYVVTARAAFTTSDQVTGFVDFRQAVYEDGFASVTTILVSLFNNDLVDTLNHNWHVHDDPVLDQSDCDPAQGHYDPYDAVMTSSNYSYFCNPQNPFACEVGDLSGKQGQYSIDRNRRLYIDEDVPLNGDKTILGRSIVFHQPEGGPGRIACANVVPDRNSFTLAFSSSVEYDYYRFTSAVASALNIARRRVIVLHNVVVPIPGGDCSRVLIAVAGPVSTDAINDMLLGTSSEMAPYNPTSSCQSERNVDILGLDFYDGGAAYLKQNSFLLLISSLIILLVQRLMN